MNASHRRRLERLEQAAGVGGPLVTWLALDAGVIVGSSDDDAVRPWLGRTFDREAEAAISRGGPLKLYAGFNPMEV